MSDIMSGGRPHASAHVWINCVSVVTDDVVVVPSSSCRGAWGSNILVSDKRALKTPSRNMASMERSRPCWGAMEASWMADTESPPREMKLLSSFMSSESRSRTSAQARRRAEAVGVVIFTWGLGVRVGYMLVGH